MITKTTKLLLILPICLGINASSPGAIRDGGVDPANLGKGDWIYYLYYATNGLGWNVSAVTNVDSLMAYYRSQGIRYVVVKAADNDQLFNGNQSSPQFTSNLVNVAHQYGLFIFGYNRSYGSNITAEISIADHVFQQGADGFVWDAEAEWESHQPWILDQGPSKAWELCSAVRARWPNKFLAHAPFAIVSLHSSFPYKEFGYWCDAVMPQVYPQNWTAIYSRPSGAINWTDGNWANFHKSLLTMPPTNLNGSTVYWTNSIKPIAPINHVYGPNAWWITDVDEIPPEFVTEFVDYLTADPHTQSPGGYAGASFWRADLHGLEQWTNIAKATIGSFPGIVNNLVMDDAAATNYGPWSAVRTFYYSANLKTAMFAGNGSGTDTNSFGTNYLVKPRGYGTNLVEFTFATAVAGDYQLFEWHPSRTDAGTVPIEIVHGQGATTLMHNQKINSGKWSFLGKFRFYPGQPASVRVRDDVLEPGAVALVDGIKLSFLPPATLPTYPIRGSAGPLSTNEMLLNWTDTASNTAMFVVSRALSSAGPYTDVAAVGGHLTSCIDTGLLPSTTYYYVVRATNFLGSSAVSRTFSGTTLASTPIVGVGDSWWGQIFAPTACTGIVAVAAGDWHSIGLRCDGAVLAWGDNAQGQCEVPSHITNAVAIAAGAYHNLAIRADGTVAAWGDNNAAQTKIPEGLKDVVGIACGSSHNAALRANGTVICWGDNTWGQCTPPEGLSNVTEIAAGGGHTVALTSEGRVYAWGENLNSWGVFAGQCVVPLGLTNVIRIAAGKYHTMALKADGTVVAFGENAEGQCSPPSSATNIVAIAAGGAHSLALTAEGRAIAWGANLSGQCLIPGSCSNLVAIAAGERHSLLLALGARPLPLLRNPALRSGRFQTVIQTLNRTQYALEHTDDLRASTWIALPSVTGNGALRVLSDPNASSTRRFYRLNQW